jgi:hypothetical protein
MLSDSTRNSSTKSFFDQCKYDSFENSIMRNCKQVSVNYQQFIKGFEQFSANSHSNKVTLPFRILVGLKKICNYIRICMK